MTIISISRYNLKRKKKKKRGKKKTTKKKQYMPSGSVRTDNKKDRLGHRGPNITTKRIQKPL